MTGSPKIRTSLHFCTSLRSDAPEADEPGLRSGSEHWACLRKMMRRAAVGALEHEVAGRFDTRRE